MINAYIILYDRSVVHNEIRQPCDLEAFQHLCSHDSIDGYDVAVYDMKDFEAPDIVYFDSPPCLPLNMLPERSL